MTNNIIKFPSRDKGEVTISVVKKLLEKFPDDIPMAELFIHAPNFSDIEIDISIRTLGRTSEIDFNKEIIDETQKHSD